MQQARELPMDVRFWRGTRYMELFLILTPLSLWESFLIYKMRIIRLTLLGFKDEVLTQVLQIRVALLSICIFL